MNSFRRLTSSAFVRSISHARQPIRSFVVSKIVPVAMGAAAFGMGCMGQSFHKPIFTFQHKRSPGATVGLTFALRSFCLLAQGLVLSGMP